MAKTFTGICLAVLGLVLLATPFVGYVHADEAGMTEAYGCTNKFCPLANVDGSQKLSGIYSDAGTSLGKFVNGFFKVALSVGAILAVLQLTGAGFMYMGSDMWSSKAKAREIIGNATIGLLLLIAIFLILNLINPKLLNLDVFKELPPIPTTSSSQPTQQSTALTPEQIRQQQEQVTQARDGEYTPQQCAQATAWLDEHIGVGDRTSPVARVAQINGILINPRSVNPATGQPYTTEEKNALRVEAQGLSHQKNVNYATWAKCTGQ